jgi:recombination-promoting nuclease RpnB
MKKKPQQTITNPHDQFFRTAMSDKRVAREFLQTHLPKELCKLIDFDELELQPRSFINDVRKETTVDLLYKTNIAGKEAYLYLLLEHQSKPDELMPFRVVKYTCNAIDTHLKEHKTTQIPLIYPIVIYHGERPYPYSTNINDLVDAPKELVERYFLKPFQLVDLGQIDDEELKQHAWAGVMEFALKHIFARDILPHLKNFTKALHQLDQADGRSFVEIVLQYLLERGELSDRDAFFTLIDTEISPEVGENIMSLAEQLRQEGKQEGKQEGLVEGEQRGEQRGEQKGEMNLIIKMLANGVEPAFIAKNTGFPLHKIKELQDKSKN